jgi:hypothetical protein
MALTSNETDLVFFFISYFTLLFCKCKQYFPYSADTSHHRRDCAAAQKLPEPHAVPGVFAAFTAYFTMVKGKSAVFSVAGVHSGKPGAVWAAFSNPFRHDAAGMLTAPLSSREETAH